MSWSYRPALDGLRSVAVYLVLLFHAGVSAAGGGFIGVDLFFVLSGFLVTNVILSEIDDTGRLHLGRFYARRIRRLLPAAVALVVATCTMFLLVAPVVRRLPIVRDAQSALLYFANWNFLAKENDYFAEGVDKSPFLHFWSLSIEEQFYFVFPVLLVLLTVATRRWRGGMVTALAALCLLSVGSQLYWAEHNVSWAYYGTDARLYQLLAGAVLAVVLRSGRSPGGSRAQGTLALISVGALLVLGSGLLDLSVSARGLAATLASVGAISGLMRREDGLMGRLLARRTPVYLGQISYGTYLWHWPVILVLQEHLVVRPAVLAALSAVVSTAFAALSFQILESPIRNAPSLRRFHWSALVAGVSVSALVAATVVPATLESERRPRTVVATGSALLSAAPGPSSRVGKAPDARVPTDLDWRALMSDKGPMPTCTIDEPDQCTVVEGSGPHVLLVGDSHARMLGPMFVKLAQEHDFTLSLNVLPACPWQAGLVNRLQPTQGQDRCADHRLQWYQAALPELDPDVVVLSTNARDDHETWEGKLVRAGHPDESLAEANLNSSRDTVSLIEDQGARVLIVEPMMGTGEINPLECLAEATWISQCAVDYPEPPASDAYYRTLDELSEAVFTVDINPVLCPARPRCQPVLDGFVVWKNASHFTTTVLTHSRREIWRRILATGVMAPVDN